MNEKEKILVLCTGNSCRSQMAEGFLKKFLGHRFEIFSAGVRKQGLNQKAVAVMSEIGLDISSQVSKTIGELGMGDFQYVITVCDNAKENCPFFPSLVHAFHRDIADPSLATDKSEDVLVKYRICRDEVENFISEISAEINKGRNQD